MAVWEIELSDGRVIDVESENEPDERSVMSALQEFEPEQPAPPPLEAFSPDVSRSMTPDDGVMTTQAWSEVLTTPFNKMSDPLVSLPRFPDPPSQEEIDFAQQFTRIPLPSAGVFEATKGATDVVAETGEFLTSPVGLAAIPALAAAGPTAAAGVGLGLGAKMIGSGLGTVAGSDDPETIGRGAGEATVGALMAFTGVPAARRAAYQATPRGRATVELADLLQKEPMALGPDVYYGLQMQPAYGRSEMIHSFIGPRLKTVLDVMQKLEPERIRLEKVRTDAQAKQQRVRQQEEAVAARREGRPVVPEGPPPQPRVSVIQEIRQRGADTVAKIQELFPQAKLSREQARELRKIAYPPQQPTTGEPSASQVQQAATIHGDVRQQPVQGEGQVPAEVGGPQVQPEAVTPEIPTTPRGNVRLYHGEGGAQGAGQGAAWYSESLDRARTFGPKISYVDVPVSKAQGLKQTGQDYVLPNALIQKAKEYPVEVQSKVEQLSEPTGTFEEEMAGIAKTAEPDLEVSLRLTPALKTKDGSVIIGEVGKTHNDIYAGQGKTEGAMLRLQEPEHGFVRGDQFMSRSEAAELLGQKEPMTSERLRDIQARVRKPESAPVEAPAEPAPVESAPVMEPMEMSVGPGAASPAEFAQRIRRAEAAAPPPSDGPVSIPGGEMPVPEVIRKEKDYHIMNVFNSGQWSFYFGRLGENAQEAWSDMALTEFRQRENIARDIQLFVEDLIEMMPRAYRKKGGEPFFNAILFKRMPEIEAQFAGKKGGENLVEAARRLKTRLEEIRTTMRDIKRNSYRKFLSNLDKDTVAELFKQNIADPEGRLKGDMADALVMDQYPDDVWFSDGSYLPQLFFGTWKVTATLKGDKQSQFVTRSETEAQASAEIFNLTRNHPEYKNASFKIEQDTVITPDMIRIGDRAFWDMIGRMKKESLEGVNVKDAVRGIIGRKAGKQKRWGSLLQRMGYAGFSRNFRQTMTAYLSGFHRWKELSALQSRVQPKIEAVRREGRPQAANRLDEIMEYLWGKPHKSTVLFDNFIATVPFLRSYVKPLALARFSRNIRMLARHGMLLTVRYSVVNRLQPIQGLYPMVGERIITQAKIMQHSKAGKKLLDEAGVSFDPGMTRTVGAPIKPRDILGVMTGERSNQEIAFLAMYKHGVESGLSHADAIKYGKLRGQLMTQFTPLITDEAPILSGPILGAMFQFKRFPMKQLELAAIMRRNKMYPGLIRMLLGFFLVGGASFFLGQAWLDKRKQKKLKDSLDESVGDKAADAVMYGLPGLLGADISGSIVLFDEPYGRDFYSKLGRTLTGPAISAPMEITRAAMTEPRQPMESSEKARVILNRIPSLRPVANLWALLDEDVDVRSPSGEVRYRRALSEVIAGFGGFRTARESNEAASIDALMEIEQEGRELKNRFYVSAAGDGDVEEVLEDIQKFNQRWPEYGITMESLSQYVKMRVKEAGKTRGERIAGPQRQHLIDQ